MKRASCSTCHSIGYKWEIDYPNTLKMSLVNEVIDALIEWTDEPDNGQLHTMLLEEYSKHLLFSELFKMTIHTEVVHRDYWSQDHAFESGVE